MNRDTEYLEVQLDRLVDGELDNVEYRALLSSLETEPDGWRRCAMAFLEAQALRGELRIVRDECCAPPAKPAITPVAKQVTPAHWRRWAMPLSVAASFLLALPLGAWLFQPPNDSPSVVTAKYPDVSPVVDRQTPQPLGNLRLSTEQGNIDVPYYNLKDGAPYLTQEPAAIPPSLVSKLREQGHCVEHSSGVVPIEMEDGAQVWVPVEDYRITPVSRRPIQ